MSSILALLRVLNKNGPFICDNCGLKFSRRKSFRAHRSKHHGSVLVFCDLCPRSFTRKFELADHMKHVHLRLRPFECNVCSYKASTRSYLKIHVLQHDPKAECEICYKLVSNMRFHLRSHDKVKCTICRKFIQRQSLKRHIIQKHNLK